VAQSVSVVEDDVVSEFPVEPVYVSRIAQLIQGAPNEGDREPADGSQIILRGVDLAVNLLIDISPIVISLEFLGVKDLGVVDKVPVAGATRHVCQVGIHPVQVVDRGIQVAAKLQHGRTDRLKDIAKEFGYLLLEIGGREHVVVVEHILNDPLYERQLVSHKLDDI